MEYGDKAKNIVKYRVDMEDYKAKYEEALGWMKELYPTLQGATKEDAEHHFPELKEGEDEVMMKKLLELVAHHCGKTCEMYLWLEKQGEQKPTELPKGEDYGIDSLWHAQRILEKTLGKVEGYQSDDGILEHKCAIEAVNRLYEQKPAWSKEDEKIVNLILCICSDFKKVYSQSETALKDADKIESFLESLKDRYTWKLSDEQIKVLNEVLNFAANHESPHWNDYIFGTLNNLIRQLKKLRGE